MTSQPRVFISHSHADNEFVSRLRTDLEVRGADVWLDAKNILVGDSISHAVERALADSDFVCLVLSNNSVGRPWVQREYRAALTLQLSHSGTSPRILPLLIDDVEIPTLLRDIRYADFRSGYAAALEALCLVLGLALTAAPFLGILKALGSHHRGSYDKFVEALRQQNVLLLSRTWRAVVEGARQLESEIGQLRPAYAHTVSSTDGGDSVVGDRERIRLRRLPPISMTEHFHHNLPISHSYDYHLEMTGVSELVCELEILHDQVAKRLCYLVPETISWTESWSKSALPRMTKDYRHVLRQFEDC